MPARRLTVAQPPDVERRGEDPPDGEERQLDARGDGAVRQPGDGELEHPSDDREALGIGLEELERALCAKVDAFLGRRRYDRVDDDFSGYRNGFARDREITIGSWAVEVRQPRVSNVPEHIPPFRSSTPIRAPRANAFAERFVRTVRRACLDPVLIYGRRHLERVLQAYVAHYVAERPHRGLSLAVPTWTTD